jgi:predicted aspartyl protease
MMRLSAIFTVVGLGLAAPLLAQPVAPAPTAPPGSAPDTLASETLQADTIAGNRLTIPVMVNGQGPFRFMIDTGSTHTVISKELAAKLALPVHGKRRLVAMGATEQVDIVEIDRLMISPARTMKRVEAPALSAKNLGADGMLGVDTLKGHRIVFDFAAETMLIEPSNSKAVREERDPTGTIVVNARSKLGQLVLVDADANGEEIWVVVDTGGQNSVGNTPFRRLMNRTSRIDSFKRVDLLGVLGDKTAADFTYVGKMRIGGVQLSNAAVAFVDAHPFKSFGLSKRPAMLLGIESLRSFRRVSIDFANRRVKFLLPEGTVTGSGQP